MPDQPRPRVIVNDPINFYVGREAEIVELLNDTITVDIIDEVAAIDAYERQFG